MQTNNNSKDPPTRSPLVPHTWPFKQVDPPVLHSTKHQLPPETSRRCTVNQTDFSTHRKVPPSDLECTLFALPARLGGLGITIPTKQANQEHLSSLLVTSGLQDHISQDEAYRYEVITKQLEFKAIVRNKNREKSLKATCDLCETLPDSLWRSVKLASEKGSSTWRSVLPLSEHGFTLHKGAFHDALALRYGWIPDRLPSKCNCGVSFSVEHALSCPKGGFPSIRHNEIRDLTATLLTEVCNNVCIELELQPVTDEELTGFIANSQAGACLDIAANGVWGGTFEKTYFDVRIFNPHALSNRHQLELSLQKA